MTDVPASPPAGEENFAAMLENFFPADRREIRPGERVRGRVLAVGKDLVFVDAGMKIDAVVERAELTDEQGHLTCAEGDELELYVTRVGEQEIRLSRAIAGAGGAQMLREAFRQGAPVEGRVRELCKGGFQVEVLHRRAFCPLSQIDLTPGTDPVAHLGATYRFLITRLEDRGRNIVVSRRELLAREREALQREFLQALQPEEILEGTVTRLAPFGAFVEIAPGVEGMVHVSEIGWSRVNNPEEALQPGQRVRVKVLQVEPSGKKGQPRIALSIRRLEEDPWLRAGERFRTGDLVRGRVTRCAPFGAFVEIAPGIEGMVHVSEMSYTRRVVNSTDVVSPGDEVAVVVKSVEPEKRRIALSLREAEGDPWAEVPARFAVGRRVEGVLEKKESFGWFVRLAPGVTGLLPIGVLRRHSRAAELEPLREGSTLRVEIAEVQTEKRRISLAPAFEDEEAEWRSFGEPPAAGDRLGALGEKLKQALAGRNPAAS
ncbi:MAG: 30S ribosomal protein S1 [Desulfobacterales bacterium]